MQVEIQYPSSSGWMINWMRGRPIAVSVDESTFGVDFVGSLDLSSLPNTREESKGIEYVGWVFAGQLEYTSLHPVSKMIY